MTISEATIKLNKTESRPNGGILIGSAVFTQLTIVIATQTTWRQLQDTCRRGHSYVCMWPWFWHVNCYDDVPVSMPISPSLRCVSANLSLISAASFLTPHNHHQSSPTHNVRPANITHAHTHSQLAFNTIPNKYTETMKTFCRSILHTRAFPRPAAD